MIEEAFIIDIPIDKIKVNSQLIDKLDCLELLLMKIASVLGDVFDV